MDRQLLPIGTVISLTGASKKLMIVGTFFEKDDTKYDYMGLPYPEGYIDEDLLFLFNHDDIQDVHFIGFVNSEAQIYNSNSAIEASETSKE